MSSYYKYRDLKNASIFRPTKKLKNNKQEYKLPTETYTLIRTTPNVKPYNPPLRVTKYDVNIHGEMVCIHIRIPRYVDNYGHIHSEFFQTFESKYSPQLEEKMLEDFLSLKMGMSEFKKKYRLTGKNAYDMYDLLLDISKRHHSVPVEEVPAERIWLLRTLYKNQILTFCVDVTTDHPRLFETIITDKDDYYTVSKDLSRAVASCSSVAYICGNYSPRLRTALRADFPEASYLTDAYQLALYIDELITIVSDPTCRKELKRIRLSVIGIYNSRTSSMTPLDIMQQLNDLITTYPLEQELAEHLTELNIFFHMFQDEVHLMQSKLEGFRTKIPYQFHFIANQVLEKCVNISPELLRLHFYATQYDLRVNSLSVTLAIEDKKYLRSLPLHEMRRYQVDKKYSLLINEITPHGVALDYILDLYTNATNNDRD